MKISNINVEGFGVLSGLELSDLSGGLNVIQGANGSGKTTLLHFLRGIFAGFDEARRLRLLPPLEGGNPGGSVSVQHRNGRYDVIRRFRPDHSDTLAIHQKHDGNHSDSEQLRNVISQLDKEVLWNVFAVGAPTAHSVDAMVRLALRDGIDLKTTKQSANWMTDSIHTIERERSDLFDSQPDRGHIAELEHQKNQLSQAMKEAQSRQRDEQDRWADSIRNLKTQIARLQRESDWLHQELQYVQAELTEVNDRLWSKRRSVRQEQRFIEQPTVSTVPDWIEEIRAIDEEIAHAQKVLRDLATSRMKLSLAKADLTGSETPEDEIVFERHREAIGNIEAQVDRLSGVVTKLDSAQNRSECLCGEYKGTLRSTLDSIRQQISLMCQELGRQQTAHEQMLLMTQRDGVDRCEAELTRQIQRLRLRRDELLHESERSDAERIQFCHIHESAWCECNQHERYVAGLPTPLLQSTPEPVVEVTEHIVETSNARPGDRDRQRHLLAIKADLFSQWQRALADLRDAKNELRLLHQKPAQFAADDSVQRVRYEYAVVEQRLADAREQWQSLAVLQSVLQRTQEKLHVNRVSPVIEESSKMLFEMTEGRYTGLRYDSQEKELLAIGANGIELPMPALSRGTLDQAALCFRLALWGEYQRRGVTLPLILDDVLPDSDEDRLQAAVNVLTNFSQQGHQLFLFTCQEHLATLFSRMDVDVRTLPELKSTRGTGTVIRPTDLIRKVSTEPTTPKTAPLASSRLSTPAMEVKPKQVETMTEPTAELRMARTQPDEPFWLQTDYPVSTVPSIGSQMASRLGTIGVRTVSDLIDLDIEATEIPLDSLQISATTSRNWQSEARLLCCVADLTGRDAQLLVAIGIMSPSELAEAHAHDLSKRIDRVRTRSGSESTNRMPWLSEHRDWPSESTLSQWIRSGRSARSYHRARDWSARRRSENRQRTDQNRSRQNSYGRSSDSSGSTSRSNRGTSQRSGYGNRSTGNSGNGTQSRSYENRERSDRSDREPRTIRSTSSHFTGEYASERAVENSDDAENKEWKFYLHMSSPVVDAPTIGPKTAERLEVIGIHTVSDLVNRTAIDIANQLDRKRITTETVEQWQKQAILVCRIPMLRGHDAQVLVACDITEPEQVANSSASDLYAIVGPFANSKEGQRLLRSAKTPDLEECGDWINFAQNSRLLKVA